MKFLYYYVCPLYFHPSLGKRPFSTLIYREEENGYGIHVSDVGKALGGYQVVNPSEVLGLLAYKTGTTLDTRLDSGSKEYPAN